MSDIVIMDASEVQSKPGLWRRCARGWSRWAWPAGLMFITVSFLLMLFVLIVF